MITAPGLRVVTAADEPFVAAAFLSGRPELSVLPAELARLQFHAWRQQHRSSYPAADDYVVVCNGESVGHFIMSRTSFEVRVVDIVVLSTHRGLGIGTRVLRDVIDTATAAGLPLRLSVWHANAGASRLYRRLGFEPCGEQHGYVTMQLRPDRTAVA